MSQPREQQIRARAQQARSASRRLAAAPLEPRNLALTQAAELLLAQAEAVLQANAEDCAQAAGLSEATLSRLKLDPGKLREMARGLTAVAALDDPLGRVRLDRLLDEGLELTQVTCPLGVLGVVFEARPDALLQIGSLAIKSGNAALLKGGSEAVRSNQLLAEILRQGLGAAGLPADAIQLLGGREDVEALLALDDLVDLVIPRGSSALVKYIQSHTRIPVLGHAEGICHIYLDAAADPAKAVAVVRDAKLQYPAACNSVETLLVHRDAMGVLALVAEDLRGRGVELRGCPRARAALPWMLAASEADWDTEYGEPILSVRVVDDLEQAIAHIHAHGSGHTEAILTEDPKAAERFLAEVDASGVYHNASTRFADGYRYGFGAEVGISTSRIHARGPVGLDGLLSCKYLLRGDGHRVADYTGANPRPFLHRNLPT
ncbi:MAG: glutamate-5-semialdehyde dehydrogenase [Holophaga sp.]|nr:glutamate-5-semialdehyde dehydrogenase [Holophaga sp.]